MNEIIELISEDSSKIVVRRNGEKIKLFKIDTEAMENKYNYDLYKASECLRKEVIKNALKFTEKLINQVPNVNEYESEANKLFLIMKDLYLLLEPHKLSYLLHHLIKDTDPEIYGRAQTFMKQVEKFHDMLLLIFNFYTEEAKKDLDFNE